MHKVGLRREATVAIAAWCPRLCLAATLLRLLASRSALEITFSSAVMNCAASLENNLTLDSPPVIAGTHSETAAPHERPRNLPDWSAGGRELAALGVVDDDAPHRQCELRAPPRASGWRFAFGHCPASPSSVISPCSAGCRRVRSRLEPRPVRKAWQHVPRKEVALRVVRISRQDERLDPLCLVLLQLVQHLIGVAHDRGTAS